MEIIAIESKAFATLVEKIEGIAAYVEASGTKERVRRVRGRQGYG